MKQGKGSEIERQSWRSPTLHDEGRPDTRPTGKHAPREPGSEGAAHADLERFRSIMDRAGEAILIVDMQSRMLVDANDTALRWLRLERNQLSSICVDDLDVEFPLQPTDDFGIHLAETRGSDRPWRSSAGVHRRRNGTTFPVDVEISSHRFGDRSYMLVVARESRHRRLIEEELRQSEDKYRALFDLSDDAIYLTSRDGLVVAANQAASTIFSCGGGLVGLPARQFYRDPSDIRRFQLEVRERGFARNLEVEFRRNNGTPFIGYLSVTLRRAGDGSILGYQCVVRPAADSRIDLSEPAAGHGLAGGRHETGQSAPTTPPAEAAPPSVSEVEVRVRERLSPRMPVRHESRANDAIRAKGVWTAAIALGIVFGGLAWTGLVSAGYPYESAESVWVWLCRCLAGGLLLVGLLGKQRVAVARGVSLSFIIVATTLVALCVGHISTLPFDLAEVVPGAAAEVWKSILSAAVFTVGYAVPFALVGVYVWRFGTGHRPRVLVA